MLIQPSVAANTMRFAVGGSASGAAPAAAVNGRAREGAAPLAQPAPTAPAQTAHI
jgi:hypothetical protein